MSDLLESTFVSLEFVRVQNMLMFKENFSNWQAREGDSNNEILFIEIKIESFGFGRSMVEVKRNLSTFLA